MKREEEEKKEKSLNNSIYFSQRLAQEWVDRGGNSAWRCWEGGLRKGEKKGKEKKGELNISFILGTLSC